MKAKMFYVYVDWTLEDEPRPFYVGMGSLKRVKNVSSRNNLHENISEKYGRSRRVEFETTSRDEALLKEIELISFYKTYFYDKSSWGCNFTIGGDGTTGHTMIMSDLHRKAISDANSHPRSDETKEKMKIAAHERASDPEWIEKMSNIARSRWENPDYREKMRDARVGKKRSDEQRERIKRATVESHSSEEVRARCSSSAKKRFENPEERERIKEKMRQLWLDPVYREKMKNSRNKNKESKDE
jgi:hypothetical protein